MKKYDGYRAQFNSLAMFSSANATISLPCGGDIYSVMLSIGFGEGQGDYPLIGVRIYDPEIDDVRWYMGSEIESRFLAWPENEPYSEKNRFAVVIRSDDGREIRVTAQGGDGTLVIGDEEYALECEWAR